MATYTPDEVNEETKIHRVMEAVELPTTVGRGGKRRFKRRDTYSEESDVGDDLCRDTGVLGFLDPLSTCVLNVHIVGTDSTSYDGRHPQKILSCRERRKKGKYIEACLERRFHFTTLVLYMDRVMVEYKKVATKQLAAALATK